LFLLASKEGEVHPLSASETHSHIVGGWLSRVLLQVVIAVTEVVSLDVLLAARRHVSFAAFTLTLQGRILGFLYLLYCLQTSLRVLSLVVLSLNDVHEFVHVFLDVGIHLIIIVGEVSRWIG